MLMTIAMINDDRDDDDDDDDDDAMMMMLVFVLIVMVSPQDIATVDILERAQVVDPRGGRSIGVLTKPDLIGPGNEDEVLAVLHNVRKPLQLGYVMVKNR